MRIFQEPVACSYCMKLIRQVLEMHMKVALLNPIKLHNQTG